MYITTTKMLAWEPLGQFHIHSHSFLNYLDITFKFRMARYVADLVTFDHLLERP